MPKPYLEEFVTTVTEDGLALDGAAVRPDGGADKQLAVVWIHGFTGKFYEPFILTIGRALAGAGYTLVTGNNRGHHCGAMMARTDGQPMLAGGWWEQLEQAPHDVAAWIDCTAALGFRRVALLGHSLGAMKVPYYQAQRQDPRVGGVILASPPLAAGRPAAEAMRQAEALVAQGRGQDLLPWGSLGGFSTISAETRLSRTRTLPHIYGEGTADPAIAQIRCPVFALYGTEEPTVGTAADLETIRRAARAAARVETRMFEGADHLYRGHETEVAAALVPWLDTLL
jgi:pimeloyl-ACP methyl ester carboxylesterase